MKRLLTESTPSEQAKQLGLTYLGFGGWGKKDDPIRTVVARTIDGKLVRTGEEDDASDEGNLGRLAILNMDDDIIRENPENPTPAEANYIKLIKAVLKSGSDLVIMHARNSEKLVAQYLKKIGVTAGPILVPFGSSEAEKKKEFVSKKIKEGYREIQYFDMDPHAISAIDSLKAPYNKLDVRIDTHKIPTLEQMKKGNTEPMTTQAVLQKRRDNGNTAPSTPPNSR